MDPRHILLKATKVATADSVGRVVDAEHLHIAQTSDQLEDSQTGPPHYRLRVLCRHA